MRADAAASADRIDGPDRPQPATTLVAPVRTDGTHGSTVFDRTTTVVPDRDERGRGAVWLDAAWSSLRGVHGGYMTAIVVRAAEAQLAGRAVRTVSVNFLRSGQVGAATVVVTPVRIGRVVAVVDVTLEQAHGTVATARLTATAPTDGTGWSTPRHLDLPPLDACVANNPPPGIRHFEHAVVRLDPATMPFSRGPRARIAGHVRPVEPRPIDAPWLAMLLDWFPPSPFTRVDPPTGGVSVDFTLHLHRTLSSLADDEWLGGELVVEQSVAGLALEHGTIVARDGTVLAESFHTRFTG